MLHASFAPVLAVITLTLAAVGIYGVMYCRAGRRVREIGVLMALGADGGDVLRSRIVQGLRPMMIGCVLGWIAAAGASRVIHPTLAFPGSEDFLCGLPLVGRPHSWDRRYSWRRSQRQPAPFPAPRALKVDPAVALRCE